VETLIEEIRGAVGAGAWTLALAGVLALPDICAALESEDGHTTGQQYQLWVDRYLCAEYSMIDARELYKMRCSLLHQGRSSGATYERLVFTVGPGRVHKTIMNRALCLDLPTFAGDMIAAVARWRADVSSSAAVKRNEPALIRWYPTGFPPYIVGQPVLT
jgi:hypothetical protein